MLLLSLLVDEQIYTSGVDLNKNDFLKNLSWISCSKIHTLEEDQIIGSIGTFDKNTMRKFIKVFIRFQNEVQRQLLDTI